MFDKRPKHFVLHGFVMHYQDKLHLAIIIFIEKVLFWCSFLAMMKSSHSGILWLLTRNSEIPRGTILWIVRTNKIYIMTQATQDTSK